MVKTNSTFLYVIANISNKSRLTVFATCLIIFGSINLGVANETDEEAHREIIEKFIFAFSNNDRDALQGVYTNDAMYFTRDGVLYEGEAAVINGLMPETSEFNSNQTELEISVGVQPEIVIDGIEAGENFGYIFGRMCIDNSGEEECNTRWFLVTEKDEDGNWRVQADLDLPFR